MKQYFDEEGLLHIVPKKSMEVMALKAFAPILAAYGIRAIVIHPEIPPKLKGVPAKE